MADEEKERETGATGEQEAEHAASKSEERGTVRASPSEGREERKDGAKRPRRADIDLASRGRRMFGLLNSTLSKAKEDNAKRNTGEAVSDVEQKDRI